MGPTTNHESRAALLRSLWPVGMLLAVVVPIAILGERFGASLVPAYLAGGTVPVLALLATRLQRNVRTQVALLLGGLAAVAGVSFAGVQIVRYAWALLILVPVSAALVVVVRRSRVTPDLTPFALVLVGFVSAAVAIPLLPWFLPNDLFSSRPFAWLALAVGISSMVIKIWRSEMGDARRSRPAVADVVAMVILAILSSSMSMTMPTLQVHHWSFYVGPAQALRQGHILLWDIPSQYGFLNELLIAALPGSTWHGLYVVNGVCNAIEAVALYVILRRGWRGGSDIFVSLLISAAAVLLRYQLPFFEYPSGGGLRYCWPIALLAIATLVSPSQSWQARVAMWLGLLIWAVGTAWSMESAVYCAGTWLPAMVLMSYARGGVPLAARWAAAHLTAALGGIGIIWLAYRFWYHVGPDWLGFVEFGLAFGGGVARYPLRVGGPVWTFVLVGGLLVGCAGLAAVHRQWHRLGLCLGAWGCIWSVASLFVAESWSENVVRAAPALLGGGIIALRHLRDASTSRHFATAAAVVMTVYGSAVVAGPFGSPVAVRAVAAGVVASHLAGVDDARPGAPAKLQTLLIEAGIRPTDALAYVNDTEYSTLMPLWKASDGSLVQSSHLWLPLAPAGEIDTLAPARRATYYDRFATGERNGGWLVMARHPDDAIDVARPHWGTFDDIRGLVERNYQPMKSYGNDDWTATYYRRRTS